MKKNNTTEKSVLNAEKISKALKEGTERTLQNIIKEAIDNIILESEEEIVDEPIDDEEETAAEDSFEVEDVDSDDEPKETEEDGEEATEEDSIEDETEDEWSDFEEFKTDENDYDFTGEGVDAGEKLIKIFDMIEDGDHVIVTKDGNELEISNETTGESDVVELDSEDANDDYEEIKIDLDDEDDDSIEIEIDDEDDDVEVEIDVDDEEEIKESTEFYGQRETAMTTPPNKEVADPEDTYSMDDVPTGDEKRFGKSKGDAKPFGEEAIEEGASRTIVKHRTTAKSGANGKSRVKGAHNVSVNGELKSVVENIKKENEALKEGIKSLKTSIKEAAVLNVNLGRIVNLLVNETTTRDEKKSILNRFSKVKTINEGATLYETIKCELNENKKSSLNIDTAVVAETKASLNETTFYQDRKSNPSLNLMDRMDNLFRK